MMKMRQLLPFFFALILPAAPLAVSAAPQPPAKAPAAKPKKLDNSKLKLVVTTDKSPVSYKVGEEITFRVSFDYGQELPAPMNFYLQWRLTSDGGPWDVGFVPIAPGKDFLVRTKLNRPGFARLQGTLTDVSGKPFSYLVRGEIVTYKAFDSGAGADVDKILPSSAEPADFKQFWAKQRAELDKVPMKPEMRRLPDDKILKQYAGKTVVYAVKIPCAGPRPVTGYLLFPADAKLKSLPAQVSFDGYGPGAQGKLPDSWLYETAKDRILFKINAHGYELEQPEEYYKKFFAERPNYALSEKENMKPETSYMRGMALRVMRAFDFVRTLPQWNGKDLIAAGGSQGGLQASWAGSLVEGLTECRPTVTWCADIGGSRIGRLGGWRPHWVPGLDYYDAAIHARHIPVSCKLIIPRAGLGDYVCPPSGLAAQYNAANCPKEINWMQSSTHMFVPENPEVVKVTAPAGRGLSGVAPAANVERFEKVDFVNASVKDGWTMSFDGKSIKLGSLDKKIDLRHKRGENGKDLPVLKTVVLSAVLTADADGWALIGAGLDWWWEFRVLKKGGFFSSDKMVPVYGRHKSIEGGNSKASFEKTDWIFRVPVVKGDNPVEIELMLGEVGLGSVGVVPASLADREISIPEMKTYLFYRDNFPEPDKTFSAKKSFGSWKFDTVQAFPAGIEYRVKGEKNWSAVWDEAYSKSHSVKLPEESFAGKEVELRIVQRAYFSGWRTVRSEIRTEKF